MWNGAYYRLMLEGDRFAGVLHEIDLKLLGATPEDGDLLPLGPRFPTPGACECRGLPRLIFE